MSKSRPKIGTRIKFVYDLDKLKRNELATFVSIKRLPLGFQPGVRNEKTVLLMPDKSHEGYEEYNNIFYCKWDYNVKSIWKHAVCGRHFDMSEQNEKA